jgi:hypothetical protein
MLKRFLILFILIFSFGFLSAQRTSGFRVQTSEGLPTQSQVKTNAVSLNNGWIGASFTNRLTGDFDFNESFLFNANVLYDIKFDSLTSWHLPIAGDVTFPFDADSFNDISVGIYPWRIISTTSNGGVFVLHGGLSYEVRPAEESELSPQMFQVSAGVEFSTPLGTGDYPLTISVTPVYQNLNLDRGSNFGIQSVFIFPVGGNLGVIGNLDVPFSSERNTEFSAGIIVNGALSTR